MNKRDAEEFAEAYGNAALHLEKAGFQGGLKLQPGEVFLAMLVDELRSLRGYVEDLEKEVATIREIVASRSR